ncbi:nuclear transport factor 2 family protein [Humibacillus sp. DSM 29435]|uniref:nuclear transport factor 2 family protein n=1 Tax=Humibacillus sp. DSM 29435 TaxID=1869167 RepID=UPI0020C81804|nr:nuclear transport factor 2 family protein [Humibacillus sp. DSM 29435]
MDIETARQFAASWVRAWNDHDLDGVLSHFDDDADFSSPVAAQLLPHTGGVLHGKQAIRDYWTIGLQRFPDLYFEIVHVYCGLDLIVINYRNHTGGLVSEVLTFNAAGQVVTGAGTYLLQDAAGASGAHPV